MMKRMVAAVVFFLLITTTGYAFLYEVNVLPKEKIQQLSDQALEDTYLDVMVEFIAAKTFYQNSGFGPKEYAKYKNLIKYKILLQQEIQKRKLEIPKIDED